VVVEVSSVKPGRRVHLTEASMSVDGRVAVTARVWHIATGDRPPAMGEGQLALDDNNHAHIEQLRNRLEDEILANISNARLNGAADRSKRLANTSNISFEYVDGQNILMHLDQEGICVSTGSACHSTSHESSPTLRAMNVPFTAAQGSIRFSLGRYNTDADIDTTLRVLPAIIEKLAAMSPYEKELATLR